MYAYFKGTVTDVLDDAMVIEVGGIGYRIFVPQNLINSTPVGTNTTIYTYTCVREDALTLYGFSSKEELKLFKLLITVSGIGPKMGLGILSGMEPSTIISAIISQDNKVLSSAPGVGAKTANRIILELKDKVDPMDALVFHTEGDIQDETVLRLRQEAYEALTGLGVGNIKASQVLNEVEITKDSRIEDIIKQLLTKI